MYLGDQIRLEVTEINGYSFKYKNNGILRIIDNSLSGLIDVNFIDFNLMAHDTTAYVYLDQIYRDAFDTAIKNDIQFINCEIACYIEVSDGSKSKVCSVVEECILLL